MSEMISTTPRRVYHFAVARQYQTALQTICLPSPKKTAGMPTKGWEQMEELPSLG